MRIKLNNVGVIKNCDVTFKPGLVIILGSSGSGKSTLMRTIYNCTTNNFSDSDITFGENVMSILIEHNNNTIKYIRNLQAHSEKSTYIVNDQTFTKLGRQPLVNVTNILKINDVEINGEKINFNFNLQFSMPFLILGSQSTLYNVLTYRSGFDVAAINDYYSADLKANNSDILVNTKLKEQLNNNLKTLENQEKVLAPVEYIYSKYIQCKHKLEIIENLKKLLNIKNTISNITAHLNEYTEVFEHINVICYKIESTINLTKFITTTSTINHCNKFINSTSNCIVQINSTIQHLQKLYNCNNVVANLVKLNDCNTNISIYEKMLSYINNCSINDSCIKDIQTSLAFLKMLTKCNSIIALLNNVAVIKLNVVDDFIKVFNLLKTIMITNADLTKINTNINYINIEINAFKVCPLCGNPICTH